jgi:hypothetical protein
MLFKILLIIHFLVDFYQQNDDKIEKKLNESIFSKDFYKTEIFKHTLLYVVLSSIIFIQYESSLVWEYFIVIGVFITHGVIDIVKIYLNKKHIVYKKQIFIIDQFLHIIILFIISNFILDNFATNFEISFDLVYIDYILVALLLGKTANVIFGILFDNFKPDKIEDDGRKNAGGLIGIMERFLIILFLMTGNIATIGFVIAAKSVARFSKLSETQFGEYFLLGTLYSVLYTLVIYYLILI